MVVTIKGDDFRATMQAYPRLLFEELRNALEVSGHAWHRKVESRIRGKGPVFPDRSSANHLHRRSGQLARSLGVKIGPEGRRSGVAMKLFSRGTGHAAIQEFGGVIKPKRAKHLWIPLRANTTPAGLTRITPRSFFQKEGAFVHGKVAFLLKGKRKDSKKQDFVPMFALLDKVTIPGPETGKPSRLRFFKTWEDAADDRTRRFRAAMQNAIARGRAEGGKL